MQADLGRLAPEVDRVLWVRIAAVRGAGPSPHHALAETAVVGHNLLLPVHDDVQCGVRQCGATAASTRSEAAVTADVAART
jgi:hypothetical protein